MPYNNTPIAPPQEYTGHVSLPLTRVRKIIHADPEATHCSNTASFAVALATEMFIQHLATTTHNVVKAERKPRRNIQYRDVANAIAKTDNLEFLVDVVPKTMTYKEFKAKRKEKGLPDTPTTTVTAEKTNGAGSGMAMLSGHSNGTVALDQQITVIEDDGPVGSAEDTPEVEMEAEAEAGAEEDYDDEDEEEADAMEVDDKAEDTQAAEEEDDDPDKQLQEEIRRAAETNGSASAANSPETRFKTVNGKK
ncbi:histone-fold-containing protein [Delitschia confertaspora ATCC 74209]|uniref:Histone-fold-containing protein n=1 Tax=Delitschia confertaspora ATCC 74209 TaxID=1513339 RepID=A0A9P4JRI6_9PLEO|nr:histone-fold-containing protein [Delitschia confertaspora ATCC 74209]